MVVHLVPHGPAHKVLHASEGGTLMKGRRAGDDTRACSPRMLGVEERKKGSGRVGEDAMGSGSEEEDSNSQRHKRHRQEEMKQCGESQKRWVCPSYPPFCTTGEGGGRRDLQKAFYSRGGVEGVDLF